MECLCDKDGENIEKTEPHFAVIAPHKQIVILPFDRFLSDCSHILSVPDFGQSVTCALIGGNLMRA